MFILLKPCQESTTGIQKGGTGYIYKQSPHEKAANDSQKHSTRLYNILLSLIFMVMLVTCKSEFGTIIEDWNTTYVASQARI